MFPSCDQELGPLCPGINTVLSLPGVLLPGVTWPAESISLEFTVSGETGRKFLEENSFDCLLSQTIRERQSRGVFSPHHVSGCI